MNSDAMDEDIGRKVKTRKWSSGHRKIWSEQRFESATFRKMKGEWCRGTSTTYGKTIFDIVDTGDTPG